MAVLEDTEVLVGQRDAEINNIGKYVALDDLTCMMCVHIRFVAVQFGRGSWVRPVRR